MAGESQASAAAGNEGGVMGHYKVTVRAAAAARR
jgi:hypothetical protein